MLHLIFLIGMQGQTYEEGKLLFLPSVLHLDDYCRLIKPPGSKKCDGINGTEGQNGQRNIGESKGTKEQD